MKAQKRRSDRCLRSALRSPGRPGIAQREHRLRFWKAIAAGRSSEDAATDAGVSAPVGSRWFREAGGMPPSTLAPSARPRSGRYLSFVEREEIALLRAQNAKVREIARQLGRAPSTISRDRTHCVRSTQRGHAQRRSGVSRHHGAMACGTGSPAPEAREACSQRKAADLCSGTALRPGRHAERAHDPWASCALEEATARAAAASAMGTRLEPGADRPSSSARFPRR